MELDGRRIVITTHNQAVRLQAERLGFTGNGGQTSLHVAVNGVAGDYSTHDPNVLMLNLPDNARVEVETAPTFVPDEVIHNGDQRILGALISLQPRLPNPTLE